MGRNESPTPLSSDILARTVSRRGLLKRAAVLGLTAPAIGSLLAACAEDENGDSDGSTDASDEEEGPADEDESLEETEEEQSAEETEEESDSEDDAGEAQAGGSVIWALNSDPVNLIPFGATPTANMWGKEFMYDSLLEWDRDLNVQPALAESYDVSDDATEYTFHLREGVVFHDGRDLTAADVVYSIGMTYDPPEPGTDLGYFESIKTATIEAVDDLTVSIVLESPDPTIPGLFAWQRHTPIVPEGIFDEIDVRNEGIGTGPFRLVEFVGNDRVVYERFEDYWKEGVPNLDELTLKVLPDEQARVAALRSGEIDGGTFSADVVRTLEQDDSLEVLKGLFAAPRVIQFTIHGEEPWSDVRVRQAINAATDRQVIIDNVYGGDAELSGPIPPGYGEWPIPSEELASEYYQVDVERARELMAEAGFEDGFDVELQSIADPRDYTQIAEIIKSQLEQININVTVQPLEIGQFAANNSSGEFEWQSTGRGMRGDPSQFVVDFRPPARPEWFTAWENEELTQLYEEALQTGDTDLRLEHYTRIQEIILEEVPNMYLVQPMSYHVVRDRLNDMYVSYTGFHTGLREAWVEDEE